MGPIPAILGGVVSIFFDAIIIAAVWKLFQMATELGEIKTILADIRSNTANSAAKPAPSTVTVPAAPFAGPISLESAEALLREVAAESHNLASAEPPKATA
jgi:hypothetical protein